MHDMNHKSMRWPPGGHHHGLIRPSRPASSHPLGIRRVERGASRDRSICIRISIRILCRKCREAFSRLSCSSPGLMIQGFFLDSIDRTTPRSRPDHAGPNTLSQCDSPSFEAAMVAASVSARRHAVLRLHRACDCTGHTQARAYTRLLRSDRRPCIWTSPE